MAKIDELKQRGAALVQQAREIQDDPKGENGKLTPEQRTKRDNLLAEAEAVRQEAQTEERLAGVESWLAPEERGRRLPEAVPDPDPEAEREDREVVQATETPEYREAFYRFARGGQDALSVEQRRILTEARALTEGVDADGGFLAPRDLVVAVEREAQDLEQLAPRMTTINTGARSIEFNKEVDDITAGWVAELAPKPEDQPAFGRVRIDVHTGAVVVWVSDELLEDTQFALEPYIATLAAEAKVELEEIGFLTGTGALQPYGILTRINTATSTPQRFPTTNVGAIHGDDFLRILFDLPRRHRRNASFVVGSQALLAARLLKDGNDNYIWQPGLQAGDPDRIVGKPVIESPELALDVPVAAGADVAICGDLRRYRVLRRIAMQVKRLEELRALTDQVGFRFRFRTGGDVQTLDAFRSLRVRAA